jgi:exosortase
MKNLISSNIIIGIIIILWFPAMIAASYAWTYGDYYGYGWFVPIAAAGLSIKRWNGLDQPLVENTVGSWLVLMVVIFPIILLLRVLSYADPAWRLPVALLSVVAAISSHYLLFISIGWKASLSFSCITLLWMTAIPWPTTVERWIVHHLTESVVEVAAEIFQLVGKPVEISGDRLKLHDITVEVTDGCSGIRSFQSFVMASCFFAEFQSLRITRGLFLFVFACIVAFIANLTRTYVLAEIRFVYGLSSFNQAHDFLGLLSFAISASLFYLISGKLAETSKLRVVKTIKINH